MSTPQAEIHEAVKYCVRRSLEHDAPLDSLREYLDLLEFQGWPAETISDIGNASCRILAIILESDGTVKAQDQPEGLASFLLRQCHKGEQAPGPPKPRSGNLRHQPPREPLSEHSPSPRRSVETRRSAPQSKSV